MQENNKLVKRTCHECGNDFFTTKGQIPILRKGDSVVCMQCGGIKVKSECSKCKTPVYLLPGLYYKRVKDKSKINCKAHTKEQKAPITIKCSHCQNDFLIPYGTYQSGLRRNQKNYFCSKDCRSEFAKVDVSCVVCGKNFRMNRGDYNGLMKNNSRTYCSEHKRKSKKASAK